MKTGKIIALVSLGVIGTTAILFLLFASVFQKPKEMEIKFPEPELNNEVSASPVNAFTILLTKDHRIFYYEGNQLSMLTETKLSLQDGIGEILGLRNKTAEIELLKLESIKKNKNMPDSVYKKERDKINADTGAVTVIIKADGQAKYKDVVNLIDLLTVKHISKFVNVDVSGEENEALKKATEESK